MEVAELEEGMCLAGTAGRVVERCAGACGPRYRPLLAEVCWVWNELLLSTRKSRASAALHGNHVVQNWVKGAGRWYLRRWVADGHMSLVLLAHSRGCFARCASANVRGSFVALATTKGHTAMACWLVEHARLPLTEKAVSDAAKTGQLPIIKLAVEPKLKRLWLSVAAQEAARGGQRHVLEYLHSTDRLTMTNLIANAAKGGHVDIIRWARERGAPWPQQGTSRGLALVGDLNALQWAFSEGMPLDRNSCAGAARNGHLDVLQWLRTHNSPWSSWTFRHSDGMTKVHSTINAAARRGHIHILEWAREHGCPWDERTWAAAAKGGSPDVLAWLHTNNCPTARAV